VAIAYLGLGSNEGDRQQYLHDALSLLTQRGVVVLKVSTFIETKPVGGPPQGLYLNGAAKIRTAHPPQKLLEIIKSIEYDLGRRPTVRNGPRPIDIDILLYEGVVLETPLLTIPHPRMNERDFVLIPLREIKPDEPQ